MYIKMYAYHIDLNKIDQYKQIQERADSIYKKYTDYTLMNMESTEQPGKFVELQIYASEQEYINSQKKINKEPDLLKLYQDFLDVIDKNNSQITEESFSDFMMDISELLK